MHHRPSRRGQAAVESALVLLVLLATLIGIFDMGQIFLIRQTLSERVRNAARWGAVHAFDAAAIRNVVIYNRPDGTGTAFFGLGPDMVTVTRSGNDTSEDRIVVSIINYPLRFFTPFIAGAFTGRPITASISYEVP